MQFQTLLCAKVGNETIYFDGNGMLYEKHPTRSHYMPTGKFVYYEYFEKTLFMLSPCMAAVGATEYDVEYTIDDEQLQKLLKPTRRNKRK